jgi:cytochrome P450
MPNDRLDTGQHDHGKEVSNVTTTGTSSCPVHESFDPLSQENLADPYPIQCAVRGEAPAFYAPSIDMWVVSRYDDVEAIFKDPATFSASVSLAPVFPVDEETKAILADGYHASPVSVNCDPPKHTRLRRHNNAAMSGRRISYLEPKIWAKATQIVDAIKPGRVDLVDALTYPLPTWVIFTFVGFPEEDHEQLKRWSDDRVIFGWGEPTPEKRREIATNMVNYWNYSVNFVAERAKNLRDDFTSDLLRLHHDNPDNPTLDEVTNMAYGFSFAGHETTTNFISNALRGLLTHRDQWEALCADPSLIPNAIEEVLRFDNSIVSWRRITTRPVTIGGVDIPENAKILMLLGAADRDPTHFENPDTLDVHRNNAKTHLGFGRGIHYCIGATLARMETRIALELLTSRAPGLRIVEDQEFTFPPNISFRGPHHLWVDWPS